MQSARIHPVAKTLASVCNQLHQAGLIPGVSGQCSVWDEDLLWLTPPDISFRDLQPEHLVMVWPNEQVIGPEADGLSERLALHQAIYQAQPTAKAILVAHPPQASHWMAMQAKNALPPEGLRIPLYGFRPTDIPAAVQLVPPQSEASRIAMAQVVFQETSILLEMHFGVIIAAPSLTNAQNALEHLSRLPRIEQAER